MTRLSLTAFVLAAGVAAGQPPKTLPAPPVELRDGVRVARIVYGKHAPASRLDGLEYTCEPVAVDPGGRPSLALVIRNVTDRERWTPADGPNWSASVTALQDDAGRPLRPVTVKTQPPARRLAPGQSVRLAVPLAPNVHPAAKSIACEVPAPPGADADVWAVTFPRPTWTAARQSAR